MQRGFLILSFFLSKKLYTVDIFIPYNIIMKKLLLLLLPFLLLTGCWNNDIVDNPDPQIIEKTDTQTEHTYTPRGLVGTTGINLEGRWRGEEYQRRMEEEEKHRQECQAGGCVENPATTIDLRELLCNHNAYCNR